MPTCDYCGGEIEFRYMGGRPTPIHSSGGWCTGVNSSPARESRKPFGSVDSYVNPNAHCPVCAAKVYFYQRPFGGRVFFDDLGWPWPKHPCTDNRRSQTGSVTRLRSAAHKSFVSKSGESLTLYELTDSAEHKDVISLEFKQIEQPLKVFRVSIEMALLKKSDVAMKDLRHAPAFVIRFRPDHRLIEFVSGRRREVVSLKISRGG
jgi:hypothetical protein